MDEINTPENLISFVDLLLEAQLALNKQPSVEAMVLWIERVNRFCSFMYAEQILPTRRSCQHEQSHRQFAAAVLIAADKAYTINFNGCRSTTYMAVVATASMLDFADELVKRKLWSSDVSGHKALNYVKATPKLLAQIPIVTLAEMI